MDTTGRHLLVEYRGCDRAVLDDRDRLEGLLSAAAAAAQATVVGAVFRRFSRQGISGVLVLEESHISIHSWPESGYAAVDFYTCGDCEPEAAHQVLEQGLRATSAEVMAVERGLDVGGLSMRVARHERGS
jgi:S-adenosylmethionine decarboxylase